MNSGFVSANGKLSNDSEQRNADGTLFTDGEQKKLIAELDTKRQGVDRVRSFMIQEGAGSVAGLIDDTLDAFMDQKVNIAVTGQSGAGKSSLINTMRSLSARTRGSAMVGTSETTTELQPYPYSLNPNIILWDLPGVNTPSYPKHDYLDKVGLDRFDALIICSSSRFSDIDLWLARQSQEVGIPFYLVRNKIDSDVKNAWEDNEQTEVDVLRAIAAGIRRELFRHHLPGDQLFLVSCRLIHQTKWDFPQLSETLARNAPDKSRRSMVMAMVTCSEDIVMKKAAELRKRIPQLAILAARAGQATGVGSVNPDIHDNPHEKLIHAEVEVYMTWFGLCQDVVDRYEVEIDQLTTRLQEIHNVLQIFIKKQTHKYSKNKDKITFFLDVRHLCERIRKSGNQKRQQKDEQKIFRAEHEANARRYEVIQTSAKELLNEALDICTELTLGILNERKNMVGAE